MENDDKQEAYVFQPIPDADEFDSVEIEDDFDDEEVRYATHVNEEFPTFTEMFADEAEDTVKRKAEERVKQCKSPHNDKRETLFDRQ
ncbi:hypothetical protein Hanom_Chr08g00735511 [Helianthus anomalus]